MSKKTLVVHYSTATAPRLLGSSLAMVFISSSSVFICSWSLRHLTPSLTFSSIPSPIPSSSHDEWSDLIWWFEFSCCLIIPSLSLWLTPVSIYLHCPLSFPFACIRPAFLLSCLCLFLCICRYDSYEHGTAHPSISTPVSWIWKA